jgi:hypothetical protein
MGRRRKNFIKRMSKGGKEKREQMGGRMGISE